MEPALDQDTVAAFGRRRRLWVGVSICSAVILLLSIISSARGEPVSVLQLSGLAALAAFVLASAILCRCPRCRRFVYDRERIALGWTVSNCEHCNAPLWRKDHRPSSDG